MKLLILTAVISIGIFLSNTTGYFPVDDAYISLTFARNLYQHGEMSYNHGELSAGVTNPLFCVLEAIAYPFTCSWYRAGIIVGLMGYALLFYAGYKLLSLVSREIALIFLFLISLNGRIIYHATMGLEPVMFTGMVLMTLYLMLAKRYWLTGTGLGLSYLIRPDAIFLVPILIGMNFIGGQK